MTEAGEMDPFKKRLYDEFEEHAHKVLGVSCDIVRELSGGRGQNIDADLKRHKRLLWLLTCARK